jgi:ribosome maturation factor RimP
MPRAATRQIEERVRGRIEALLESQGYELVDIRLGGGGRRPSLTVLADKPGGLDTGDCQHLSQQIGLLLDALDPLPGSYDLIVSSPGVERPLTRPTDYERFAGKLARITTADAAGSRRSIEGRLQGLEGDSVLLAVADGEELQRLVLADIQEARLVFDWDEELATLKQSQAPAGPDADGRRTTRA